MPIGSSSRPSQLSPKWGDRGHLDQLAGQGGETEPPAYARGSGHTKKHRALHAVDHEHRDEQRGADPDSEKGGGAG